MDLEALAELWHVDKQLMIKEYSKVEEFKDKLENAKSPYKGNAIVNTVSNRFTVKQLNEMYPWLDWQTFLNQYLPPDQRLSERDVVYVTNKEYLDKLGKILEETPKE